jgi:hypothetical protein
MRTTHENDPFGPIVTIFGAEPEIRPPRIASNERAEGSTSPDTCQLAASETRNDEAEELLKIGFLRDGRQKE